MTRIYAVKQERTGITLWTGAALDETGALDAMAREAGYADYASLPTETVSGGAHAVPLTF